MAAGVDVADNPPISVIGCPDCALIQVMPVITSGRLQCRRCHGTLERAKGRPSGAAFAFALTTIILLVPANLMILMRVSRLGFSSSIHLATGITTIWDQGWPLVAVVVTLEAVVLPFLRFGLLARSLGAVLLGRPAHWAGPAFRIAEQLDLWAMPDVFLIGIAIEYSRLAPFANVMLPSSAQGGRCPRCRQRLWRRPGAVRAALALTLAGLLLHPIANLYPVSVLAEDLRARLPG